MESQQSQAWFEIAQKVAALVALPGARERFRERVKEAAAEWLRRFDAKRQREEARSGAVKQKGAPHGSGRLPADPKDGSFHWLEDFHDGKRPMEAWLPAELSPDLDPDDSLPLPVPAKREVSLAERYAVLAAVWDARWKGDEKINPWVDDEFCREGNRYWFLVHADHPDLSPTGLSDQDAAVVRTWIADVEADLGSGMPAAVGAPPVTNVEKPVNTRKATVEARMIDLIRDPFTHTWTCRQFQERIGCKSPSTITNTAAWKQLRVAHEMARQEKYGKPRDRRRKPRHYSRTEAED